MVDEIQATHFYGPDVMEAMMKAAEMVADRVVLAGTGVRQKALDAAVERRGRPSSGKASWVAVDPPPLLEWNSVCKYLHNNGCSDLVRELEQTP